MDGWKVAAALALAGCLSAGAAMGASRDIRCALPDPGADASVNELADQAAACLRANDQAMAGKLFYAHRARARALAAMGDPSWKDAAQSVQAQIGAPVHRWLGGDIAEWRSAIAWGLRWDQSAPWSQGAAEARRMGASEASARETSRAALRKLSADLASMDKAKFYARRQKAGLPIRDPDSKPAPLGR